MNITIYLMPDQVASLKAQGVKITHEQVAGDYIELDIEVETGIDILNIFYAGMDAGYNRYKAVHTKTFTHA